jgi:hypothetical protein
MAMWSIPALVYTPAYAARNQIEKNCSLRAGKSRLTNTMGPFAGPAVVLAADTHFLEFICLPNEKDLAHMNAAAANGAK